MCLEGVWRVSGRCLEGVWKVSGRCQEGVCKVSARCLGGSKGLGRPNEVKLGS